MGMLIQATRAARASALRTCSRTYITVFVVGLMSGRTAGVLGIKITGRDVKIVPSSLPDSPIIILVPTYSLRFRAVAAVGLRGLVELHTGALGVHLRPPQRLSFLAPPQHAVLQHLNAVVILIGRYAR